MDVAFLTEVQEGSVSRPKTIRLQQLLRSLRPFSRSRVTAQPTTRVAVLGLYRSGSTAVAGVLHHLGVDMGAPFFHNFYESAWLSKKLRVWWNEPNNIEKAPASKRVRVLKQWIEKQERNGAKCVGMKHPLLSLCGPDLLEAWGSSVRFIWTWRPLDKSIHSLHKLKWWSDEKSEAMQKTLWDASAKFLENREHLRIDFAQMMADPRGQITRLVDYLGLEPSAEQLATAIESIQPTSKE
jgi:sulfotransferase family protein